jgi:cytochrome c1
MEYAWTLSDTVLLTSVPPEAVLLDTATGERYVLNPLGTAICNLCEMGKTTTEIVTAVEQQFPQSLDQIAQDVYEFIDQLQAEGLIIPKPQATID